MKDSVRFSARIEHKCPLVPLNFTPKPHELSLDSLHSPWSLEISFAWFIEPFSSPRLQTLPHFPHNQVQRSTNHLVTCITARPLEEP